MPDGSIIGTEDRWFASFYTHATTSSHLSVITDAEHAPGSQIWLQLPQVIRVQGRKLLLGKAAQNLFKNLLFQNVSILTGLHCYC